MQQRNADLDKEIERMRDHIKRLTDNPAQQDLEIRERLKLVKPARSIHHWRSGEKVTAGVVANALPGAGESHGVRSRPAHNASHISIRIQRGICKLCKPDPDHAAGLVVPGGHYSLNAVNSGNGKRLVERARDYFTIPVPSTVSK